MRRDEPGLRKCRQTPGWQCPDNVCATVCGDHLVAGNEECDPDDVTCDNTCRKPVSGANDSCTLAGYYLVRQTDYSLDNVVNQVQTSNSWYFYRFVQTGANVQVDQVLYCGYTSSGTANVRIDDAGLRALLYSDASGREESVRRASRYVRAPGEHVRAVPRALVSDSRRAGRAVLADGFFDGEARTVRPSDRCRTNPIRSTRLASIRGKRRIPTGMAIRGWRCSSAAT